MKLSLQKQAPLASPKGLVRSTHKNMLTDRLFDTPALRAQSQRRPRVFTSESGQSKLTPVIVKEYHSKKQTLPDALPPLDSNPCRQKMMTE